MDCIECMRCNGGVCIAFYDGCPDEYKQVIEEREYEANIEYINNKDYDGM